MALSDEEMNEFESLSNLSSLSDAQMFRLSTLDAKASEIASAPKAGFFPTVLKSVGEAIKSDLQFAPKLLNPQAVVESPTGQFLTKPRLGAVGAPIEKFGERIQKSIPEPAVPTASPLSMAQQTLAGGAQLTGGAVKGLGSIVGGMGIADLATMGAPALEKKALQKAAQKMGTIAGSLKPETQTALEAFRAKLPAGFPEGAPVPPVVPGKIAPVYRSELERAPTLRKGIAVDEETRAYNEKEFNKFITKTIKGDTIPLTHETTKDVVEKILKGEKLGEPTEGIFASVGHLSKPSFVPKGYRIYLDVPKKDKVYMTLDTMDHPGIGDFKGNKGHVYADIQDNRYIREIVDSKGNVVYRNPKSSVVPEMPPTQPVAQGVTPPPTTPGIGAGVPGAPQDPVTKLTQLLSKATDIRSQQDAMYKLERAERAKSVGALQQSMTGKEGYIAQRAALKGPLEKADLSTIAPEFSPQEMNQLIDMVRTSPNIPAPMDKFAATEALMGLMGEQGVKLPGKSQLDLLARVFPKEMIETIIQQRPLAQKIWETTKNVLNIPRTMMSTLDMSIPLRQGIVVLPHSPKRFAEGFKSMFKYAFDEKAYDDLILDIQSRPTYQMMKDSGLSLTGVGELSAREESFASNLVEKIPGFGKLTKMSNRAASGFLNKVRADVFDDLVKSAKAAGATDDPRIIENIAEFVNNATGRGGMNSSLEKASEVLNATFFSPRLMASRFNMLNPMYYMKLDPFTRKEALKAAAGLVGGGLTTLGLANAAGAEVGTDPRSADFGKIKIGNTRYDIWGGFQQYAVLLSRLATGEMVSSTTGKEFKLGEGYKPTTRADIIQRFFESKTAPIASLALGMARGQNALGEEFKLAPELADRFIPMLAQDIADLSHDKGFVLGPLMATPGFFGVGSQTYTDEIPMKEISKNTGQEKIRWRQAPSLGERAINWYTNQELSNIPQEQWPGLLEKKRKETQEKTALDTVRERVLETGNPERYGDKLVYLQSGVVHTKDVAPQTRAEKMEDKVERAKKSVESELYSLEIPAQVSPRMAYNLSRMMADKRYKTLTREQKRAHINRLIFEGMK